MTPTKIRGSPWNLCVRPQLEWSINLLPCEKHAAPGPQPCNGKMSRQGTGSMDACACYMREFNHLFHDCFCISDFYVRRTGFVDCYQCLIRVSMCTLGMECLVYIIPKVLRLRLGVLSHLRDLKFVTFNQTCFIIGNNGIQCNYTVFTVLLTLL